MIDEQRNKTEWTKARTNKQINKMKTTKKAQTAGRAEWMNEQTKEKKERMRRRAVRRDGGNEDELELLTNPLHTQREMTEGSYRKKHKDEWLLCRLLIWLCSKFAPSRPTWEEHARTSEKVEQCRSKKGVLERGRAIFWALTEQALPSPHPIPPSRFPPFPENSLYHTHWTNYKHCLAAKSWGPRRVTARMGLNARSPEPQHRRAGERPFLSVCFCKARTDGADSV